jgi:hypothetical protein
MTCVIYRVWWPHVPTACQYHDDHDHDEHDVDEDASIMMIMIMIITWISMAICMAPRLHTCTFDHYRSPEGVYNIEQY